MDLFAWWWKFLFDIGTAILKVIDGIYKIFMILSGGAKPELVYEVTGNMNDTNILVTILRSNTIGIMFWGLLIFAITIFCLCVIIGIVRSEVNGASGDPAEPKLKILRQGIKAVGFIVLIPIIFSIAVWATSILIGGIVSVMGSGTSNSFAQSLFEICLPSGTDPVAWSAPFGEIKAAMGGSVSDFNFFICYLAGIVMIFILGVSALQLVERIISIVFLYLVSPFVAAVSPLDDGNRLNIWKDLLISKLLGVAGMLVCFYIYFSLLPIIGQIFTRADFINQLVYLIFAIGGALAASKGGHIVATLVGHSMGTLEGQSQAQTARLFGTGAKMGAAAAVGLGVSSIKVLRSGAGMASTGGASGAEAAGAAGRQIASGFGQSAQSASSNFQGVLSNSAQMGKSFSAHAASFASQAGQHGSQGMAAAQNLPQTTTGHGGAPPAGVMPGNFGKGFGTTIHTGATSASDGRSKSIAPERKMEGADSGLKEAMKSGFSTGDKKGGDK